MNASASGGCSKNYSYPFTNTYAMKPTEKRALLVEFVELMVRNGYDISCVVGRPLSYFNYEMVRVEMDRIKEEYAENNYTPYDEAFGLE